MESKTKARSTSEANQREQRSLEVAYQAACESIVLLKNEGVLPFKGTRIAAFGPGVSRTIKGGTGSGEVNERHSVSILEGLENRGFEVLTKAWIEDFEAAYEKAYTAFQESRKPKLNPLALAASVNQMFSSFQLPSSRAVTKADIANSCTENCIYVLSRQAGEGGDRRKVKGDYCLTDAELKDITFCAKNYKHFALIINCGSAIDMAKIADIKGIGAIVYISQLGTQGGNAVADILSGKAAPSGKLADSWAKTYDDLPFADEYSYLNGNLENEYYKEGIFVGYRFFDSFGVAPQYPFGFGLGYTHFACGKASVSVDGSRVEVKIKVRNAGRKHSGKETMQVYVTAPEGKLNKEYQRLTAFEKTRLLAPGESQELTMHFDMAKLSSFRFDDASFVLEAGDYIVRVGNSSRDTTPAAILRLEREIAVSRHEHVCPLRNPFLELTAPARAAEVLDERLPVLIVDPASVQPVKHVYAAPAISDDRRARAFVDGLSLREMADIVVGIGMFGGEKGFDTPGAAGYTTSKFWERGLANITLCDGPAGLRLTQQAAMDENGKIKPLHMPISAMEALPKSVKSKMLGDPEQDRIVYQYTTAFPVEAALAQTWNTELIYEIGKAMYEEMKEYGCTYWLAPAVNIHRNPLCGRNFEYFSEDPFLCGQLAAAMVRGVQQEEGYYVTVKHFACNNQEDNRNGVSSNLTERALREIYLPAFEAAVREGGAKGIMTSYNRVNGVYAPNSYDLCTKILRNEWGFDGVVMTDWFSTIPAKNGSALAMKAGNDLIMPGEPLSKAGILLAVKTGLISEEDVKRCCCNVVKAIMDSAVQKEYIMAPTDMRTYF